MPVLVGIKQRHPMRLLMMRVPPDIAQQRRERVGALAARRKASPLRTSIVADAQWLLLLTNAPTKRLSLQEAIVRLARTLAN